MLGAILIVVALLALVPIVLMTMMAVAGGLSELLTRDAEARHEGSELIELNK
jgi:hypothetical protein